MNTKQATFRLPILFVIGFVTPLIGCGFAAIEGVSMMATDKAASDHLVSLMSGKDCSSLRKEQGLAYCVEDQPSEQVGSEVFCYPTLGVVTCYTSADPRRSPSERINTDDNANYY